MGDEYRDYNVHVYFYIGGSYSSRTAGRKSRKRENQSAPGKLCSHHTFLPTHTHTHTSFTVYVCSMHTL